MRCEIVIGIDARTQVSARQVLHALVELLPALDAEKLNETIIELNQRKNA
ncbi:hypothetical protein K3R80_004603 [Salmonella enterica]|nr:hypothetical protein [Salmonella enterica]